MRGRKSDADYVSIHLFRFGYHFSVDQNLVWGKLAMNEVIRDNIVTQEKSDYIIYQCMILYYKVVSTFPFKNKVFLFFFCKVTQQYDNN